MSCASPRLGVINSTSIFFVLKNSIVILLLAYRLCVVYLLLSEDDETGSKSYGMRGRSRSLDGKASVGGGGGGLTSLATIGPTLGASQNFYFLLFRSKLRV